VLPDHRLVELARPSASQLTALIRLNPGARPVGTFE